MQRVVGITKSVYIVIFLFVFTCGKSQDMHYNDDTVLDIMFADFFSGDIFDFAINDTSIFKEVTLTGGPASGTTGMWMQVILEGDKYFVIYFRDKERMEIKLNANVQFFRVTVNGKAKEFKIKRSRGKYILINKDEESVVSVIQTKTEPILD